MAAVRPESLGFSDPFLPPVCFTFFPDLLTLEQSPTGPLCTRLLQPQVKIGFPSLEQERVCAGAGEEVVYTVPEPVECGV